jgi:hypothetical protein
MRYRMTRLLLNEWGDCTRNVHPTATAKRYSTSVFNGLAEPTPVVPITEFGSAAVSGRITVPGAIEDIFRSVGPQPHSAQGILGLSTASVDNSVHKLAQ